MTNRRFPREKNPDGKDGGFEGFPPAWGKWIWSGFWYSLIFLVLLSPLYSGKTEPWGDARDQFYPSFAYQSDSIAEGRFPLWDPYTSCGSPFHAEPQHSTLNPLAIVLGLSISDSGHAFVAYWTFTWWLGGIGMLWLSWHFGSGPNGGLFAALAYALSGFFIGHAEHTSYVIIAAWLPWIFGFADRAVSTGGRGYALLAGSAMGVASLGGYPGLVAFTGLAIAVWFVVRLLLAGHATAPKRHHSTRHLVEMAITLVIIAVTMVAIWSPVLHAFFTEGAGYTERVSPLPPEAANYGEPFSLPAWISIFFPLVTIVGREWMGADISMTNGYVGILAFPLAFFWFLKGSGEKRPWAMLVFFLFMFLVSIGGNAGVRTALYYLFPPMRFVRFSAPFRIFWILPVCLAAGLGYSSILSQPHHRRYASTLFAGWMAAVVIAIFFLTVIFPLHDRDGSYLVVLRSFLPAAVVLPVATGCLWLCTPAKKEHLSRLFLSAFLVLSIIDMSGHFLNNQDTVWTRSNALRRVESAHRRSTHISGEPGPRLPHLPFELFNVQQVIKSPVVQGYTTMVSRGFDEVLCKSRFVEILMSPLRFWISPGVEVLPSKESALSVLASTGFGDPVPVFIENSRTSLLHSDRIIPGSLGKAEVLFYAPERVDMNVDVPGREGGFLASTERYAPGWKAWIDGIPQEVVKTNLYFRGIFVPPGRHFVRWTYEPRLWNQLVILSYSALVVAFCGGIGLLIRTSRGKNQPMKGENSS